MNLSKYFYLTFVCLVFATSTNSIAASQGLDANEAAIVAWSAAHNEEAIDLLEQLDFTIFPLLRGILNTLA